MPSTDRRLLRDGEEVTPMTITLPLQPQEEARLAAAARASGVSTDDYLREALKKILAESPTVPETATTDRRPIWEVMLGNIEGIPPEEFAKLPTDGASEHDHYLYGRPKADQ